MNKNGHSYTMHFCPVGSFLDHTGSVRTTGSMAWNSILKQRLPLPITNQTGVLSLKTFPIHHHGPSSPNTAAYSNSMHQGKALKDSRNLSEKACRKSFTAKKALFIAYGVRCVLSPRPSNCPTSSPYKDKKDRAHSTSARGQQCSRECVETEREMKVWETYTGIKRTENRERARSSVYRQRVPLDSTQRPSTVPLEMGRRVLSTPEIPMCKIIWRRTDSDKVLQDTSQHLTEDLGLSFTPSLHLFLPSSYQPEEQGEDMAAGEDKRDEDFTNKSQFSSEQCLKIKDGAVLEIKYPGPDLQATIKVTEKQNGTEELREHDITMESQKQDVTINKTQDERQNDFTDATQYDVTDAWQNDKQKQTPEETFENDTMQEKYPQDDNKQKEITESHERSLNKLEYSEKTEGIYRRTKSNRSTYSRLTSKTRYPATATALTFPSMVTDRKPSPTVSLLPSFYRTSFGYRIRTMSENSKTRTRKACDDNRLTQMTNDTRHSIEIKGNPCLLKTRAGLAVGPHPKIMSTERGSQSRKLKTTKTFLWGP